MKLYVGNLSKQITSEQLSELAVPYGTVASVNLPVEKLSGESRGFGFVEFSDETEGKAALAGLDGREVNGMVLKVAEARPKPPRQDAR